MKRATGARGSVFMSKRIKYTDEPLGRMRVVRNFLRPSE